MSDRKQQGRRGPRRSEHTAHQGLMCGEKAVVEHTVSTIASRRVVDNGHQSWLSGRNEPAGGDGLEHPVWMLLSKRGAQKKVQKVLGGGFPKDTPIPMSRLFRTLGTSREIGHSPQDHPIHIGDQKAGAVLEAERWMLLPFAPSSEVKHDFSALEPHNWVLRDGELVRVRGVEYVEFLKEEKRRRTYYSGPKKRGDKISQCNRLKCLTPLVELTLTSAPWLTERASQMTKGSPKKVEAGMCDIAVRLIPDVERRTGCKVIGFTIHYDTGVPHINFALAKVSIGEGGVMRMIQKNGLKLGGGWLCGVDRQRRGAGIIYLPHDEKFQRAMAKFRERYADADLPNDMSLCRRFDELAEVIFGSLKILKELYRDRIERTRASALAKRKALLQDELRALEKTGITPQSVPTQGVYHGKN